MGVSKAKSKPKALELLRHINGSELGMVQRFGWFDASGGSVVRWFDGSTSVRIVPRKESGKTSLSLYI